MNKIPKFEFDEINRRLIDKYGKFEDQPYFRLVWSNDCFEKRWMTHTDEGWKLLQPEVRLVPKYLDRKDRYVLEGLMAVPLGVETDLTTPISYEPVWTFRHGDNYVRPTWYAIWTILEIVRENQENAGASREFHGEILGVNEDLEKEEQLEKKQARVIELEKELFGNETAIGTALSHRSGVGYGPGSSPNSMIIKGEK